MPDFDKLTNEELINEAKRLYLEKEELKLQLDVANGKLARMRQDKFGSKSEKNIASDQMTLFNFDEVDELAVKEENEIQIQTVKEHKRRAKKQYSIDNLPENIETEEVTHDIEAVCPVCHGDLHLIKIEEHRELIYIPSKYNLIIHQYPVYGCRRCEKENGGSVYSAAKEGFLFPKSPTSPSVVAHLMTDKYLLGLPLNRSIELMHSQGIMFRDQTCAKWMIDASEIYLSKIYDVMHNHLIHEDIICADETYYNIFTGKKDAPARKKKMKKTYIWMFRTGITANHPIVMYHYGGGRNREIATNFLKGFNGYLTSDNYSGYNGVEGATRVLCNVHARRYMSDLYKEGYKHNPVVLNVLEIYREIFHRDDVIRKELGDNYEQIKIERERHLRGLFNILFTYLEVSMESIMRNSDLYKAVNYILKAKEGLTNFFKDGRLELSNNISERSLKIVINNRKSSLFFASEKGATGSCVITTVVQTAKANNLKVEEYITYILKYLSSHLNPDQAELEKLMPWSEEMKEKFEIKKKQPESPN